ncbi:hypothetical protein ASE74_02640 [Pedobacter sp. Leaf216]|uniref:hypothetical protein n=1 Tax=Pedobacter sp. Leaf216 TaxID=1735684 RepID=UPI0006F41F8E|nr:hypothetical protein [Pedobacter sp. Leaf216]KQM74898.1 hypothetical protein ASE74_02640 [Pedobacter sp. Leaf216]
MKKLMFILLVLFSLSCKKSQKEDPITKLKWVLETAIVSPALNIRGELVSDYKKLEGNDGCLSNNFTLTFLPNGTYRQSSTGSLCDMVENDENQKWRRSGEQIILGHSPNTENICTINGNKLTYTLVNSPGIFYSKVVYTFKAQ